MHEAYMIIDGQWGSTGKGLIAGYLALNRKPDAVVCNFGPNAGHTVITPGGVTVMTQQLPTAIIAPSITRIFIGPGAIINPDLFLKEIRTFGPMFLKEKSIFIHPRAAVVLPRDLEAESESLKFISSTRKGVGAAIASKVMRRPDAVVDALLGHPLQAYVVSAEKYDEHMDRVSILQIESAQGFELGLNTGFSYPYCTSRDVTPFQVMADCGLPGGTPLHDVIASIRTFPIRVGDQWEPDGRKVGVSGPVYPDQTELAWDEIDYAPAPEKTTVTGKIRRVFTFSDIGFQRMLRFVNPSRIFLNFVNYLEENPNWNTPKTEDFVNNLDRLAGWPMVRFIGRGPNVKDVLPREK